MEVGIENSAISCTQWITNLAGNGLTWLPINQLNLPGQSGTADQETMGQACDLTDGIQELYVEDAGGMFYGNDICSQEEQNGWTPESSPGSLAISVQQAVQANADAVASAAASAAASQAAKQRQQDVATVNSDGQALAGDITQYDADVSTAKAAMATVQSESLCSGGTSDQQTYNDAQNVYDDGQSIYDNEGKMSTDLTTMRSDWSKMTGDWGGVPFGVSQAQITMKAADTINPGAYGESAVIQNAAIAVQVNTDNCT